MKHLSAIPALGYAWIFNIWKLSFFLFIDIDHTFMTYFMTFSWHVFIKVISEQFIRTVADLEGGATGAPPPPQKKRDLVCFY